MGSSSDTALDASNIVKHLWVGGKPPFDRDLPFDTLALCAQEIQPERMSFCRQVIRVPLPDAALSDAELRRALQGGQAVAAALTSGRRVLVTCAAGLNRSALVASLGLGLVGRRPDVHQESASRLGGRPRIGWSPLEIIQLMRDRRDPMALSNPHFVKIITRYVAPAQIR